MAFKYKDEWKLYQKEQKLDNTYYSAQQKQLNQWNQESAEKQMEFQKMMSDTSHVREVQDLLKAGLNPVLSANNGASTPSGAYASIDSTPLSSAAQSRNANRQMRQNMIQNKMQLANAMSIAKYQAKMQYAASKYATDMSYQLGLSGLQNQMDMALLPYQEVNKTTQYQVDNPTDPLNYLVKMIQGVVDGATGSSNAHDTGKFAWNLIKGVKGGNPSAGSSAGMKKNAENAVEGLKQMLKRSAKNYNISKKDWLMSYHEYAKGNWRYNSEKWKRDNGYYEDFKRYK